MEIVGCTEEDYETLAGIWERSVLATHSFLKQEDFNEIKAALNPDYSGDTPALYGVLASYQSKAT